MSNEHEIRRAGAESWYNRSGLREGADPEVLEDLGFEPPERTEEIARDLGTDAVREYSATQATSDTEESPRFAETDDGVTPDYFQPFDDDRLPTTKHIEAAKEHLPGIKEKLDQLRDDRKV